MMTNRTLLQFGGGWTCVRVPPHIYSLPRCDGWIAVRTRYYRNWCVTSNDRSLAIFLHIKFRRIDKIKCICKKNNVCVYQTNRYIHGVINDFLVPFLINSQKVAISTTAFLKLWPGGPVAMVPHLTPFVRQKGPMGHLAKVHLYRPTNAAVYTTQQTDRHIDLYIKCLTVWLLPSLASFWLQASHVDNQDSQNHASYASCDAYAWKKITTRCV